MKNKKSIRFVGSLVLFPIMTLSLPFGNFLRINTNNNIPHNIVAYQKTNIKANGILAYNQAIDQEAEILETKAKAIDAYFKKRDMPLFGMGLKMVQEAEKNNIDWRLLPAISIIETSGGKNLCKNKVAPNNPFGWGSCKIGFKNIEESIEIVAKNLGGSNPNTAPYYRDKNTEEILKKYNSVIPTYTKKALKIMNLIGEKEIPFSPEEKV